jgi:S1-C subfamily serine protease
LWTGALCLAFNRAALRASDGTDAPDIRRDATVVAVEQVMPSVVNISAQTVARDRDLFGPFWAQQPSVSKSLGSGVIIDEAGYLLTNDHVVRGADQIGVELIGGTNAAYYATVVATDPKTDVALLKLNASPGEKFHAIRIAREDDVLLGETVLAMGNPFGLGGSVTRGILSSKNRSDSKPGESLDYMNWLQTDAPINRGNSGGPLVNLRGELIGINVAEVNEVGGEPASGIGFAIPIREVMRALSDIFPTECVKSYWFGARVSISSSPLTVTSVQPESPAGRAGLLPGDSVLEVNGKAPRSFIDFANLVAASAGSELSLAVQRGASRQEVTMRLVPEKTVFNNELVRKRLGFDVAMASQEQSGGLLAPGAMMVTGVEEGGPGAKAGLETGMIIFGLDGERTTDITTMAKQLYAKKPSDHAWLDVLVIRRTAMGYSFRRGRADLVVR